MTVVFKERGFLTRAWGQRAPRASRGQGVRGDHQAARTPRAPWPPALGFGTATSPAPVPTCSRRFCQRPHGLSSRMSLSSSLSSSRSRSRSRPRLGAGSGAAMARRAQAAALRASRRPAPARPGPAPGSPTWSPAEQPPLALLGSGNWEVRARSGPEGGADPPLRSRLCGPVLECSSTKGGRAPPRTRPIHPDHSCSSKSSAPKRRAPQRHRLFLRRPLLGYPGQLCSPCAARLGWPPPEPLWPTVGASSCTASRSCSNHTCSNSARRREPEWGSRGQGHLGAGT